jgi:phospholipid/cholesterol/gamma-HCH transport system permease protein
MNALTLQRDGEGWRLCLNGNWSLASIATIDRELEALPGSMLGTLICDWSHAEQPGIAPVWLLLKRLSVLGAGESPASRLRVRHEGAVPPTVGLLRKLALDRSAVHSAPPATMPAIEVAIGDLGLWVVQEGAAARGVLGFFGRIAAVFGQIFSRPRALRLPSIARHIYEAGITAIPIVALIAFLISVVVAYLGAQQLRKFGADIFVVDLVTIGVLREMGVLLTAIIVAGRSGSAFAAEIGVMQLNDEVDALRAMGLNPVELLVVPRVLALVIALPLLTVIADAMGLAGGALLSLLELHIPPAQFTVRLHEALAPTTFWAGLVKAPVFGLLIGVVGAYRGMQVRESARELGRLTTVAVVQSIFQVILADALFAILFEKIDF